MKELISVIVPAFNIEKYIAECIESLTSQTYGNIEVIVVDDGSTDATGEIIDTFIKKDGRIKVIHQENLGVAAARKAGIDAAGGEFVGFVDGDDWISPDMYEKLSKGIQGVDICSCGVWREWSTDRGQEVIDRLGSIEYSGIRYDFFMENMIYDFKNDVIQPYTPWMVNKLFRTSIVKRINMDMMLGLSFSEDACFLYQYMLLAKSVYSIDKVCYHYRYRDTSSTHSQNHDFLCEVGRVYRLLRECFLNSQHENVLIKQLQKWIEIMVCIGIGRNMGFDYDCQPIQFVTDCSELYGSRILLYGAGKCGQDYFRLLNSSKHNIVAWCDKDAGHYRKKGLGVEPFEYLLETNNKDKWDIVLIAVSARETADAIKNELMTNGIDGSRVIWKEPVRAF